MKLQAVSPQIGQIESDSSPREGERNIVHLAPVLAAMAYPFILRAFHQSVDSPAGWWLSALFLAMAFVVPTVGFAFALHARLSAGIRRLAFATIVAPTLFVFLGVIQTLLSSPLPDEVLWLVIWFGLALLAWMRSHPEVRDTAIRASKAWRIAHGISGSVVLLYVLFHITNHLFGLVGPTAHAAVMDLGRHIYRAPVIEPLLVVFLIFQVSSGLRLAWQWSASSTSFYRTFQVASGAYLAVFILGHMNSVFIYARSFLGIPTDWAFAVGAPMGLIHDAWNIRLLPHYALGVFFVLSHIVAGLRVVLIAHGIDQRIANRLWLAGVGSSGVIAAAIIAGMCGLRV